MYFPPKASFSFYTLNRENRYKKKTDLSLEKGMVLPLIRTFSFNTGLGEITRDKGPFDWVSELEGVKLNTHLW